MAKRSMLVIAVTGTPGSGKTSFASALSKETGIKPIELNDLVEANKLFSGIDEMGSKIVKMEELDSLIAFKIKELRKDTKSKAVILVGHLIADLEIKPDITVVTRVGLQELINRLEARKYQKEKVRENIVSESIDYCGASIKERCNYVYEVESDEEKNTMIEYLKKAIKGEKSEPPQFRDINKLNDILELVYDGNKYSL